MLRGIIGNRNAIPADAMDMLARALRADQRMAPERTAPRPSETASRGFKWPWDGQPDYAACNFAVVHLFRDLPEGLEANGRVHAETCLAAIGAIAGFAAQHALFTRLKDADDTATLKQLQTVRAITGGEYFFGEPLNRALLPVSKADADAKLWSVAAGGAIAAGLHPSQLPNTDRMFAHVVNTLVGKLEGLPSVPERHFPKLPVQHLLADVWPIAMACFLGRIPGEPREFGVASIKFWPAIAAYVASSLIRQTKSAVDPRTGLIIVMESAIYASKLMQGALTTD